MQPGPINSASSPLGLIALFFAAIGAREVGHNGLGPRGSSNDPDRLTGLEPTFVSVDEELLRRALQASEDAKEWANELLTVHDQNLGRTTTKNKMWAAHLEQSIRLATSTIAELRKALRFD